MAAIYEYRAIHLVINSSFDFSIARSSSNAFTVESTKRLVKVYDLPHVSQINGTECVGHIVRPRLNATPQNVVQLHLLVSSHQTPISKRYCKKRLM